MRVTPRTFPGVVTVAHTLAQRIQGVRRRVGVHTAHRHQEVSVVDGGGDLPACMLYLHCARLTGSRRSQGNEAGRAGRRGCSGARQTGGGCCQLVMVGGVPSTGQGQYQGDQNPACQNARSRRPRLLGPWMPSMCLLPTSPSASPRLCSWSQWSVWRTTGDCPCPSPGQMRAWRGPACPCSERCGGS